MAFIANTAFEARIVNDRFDDLANIAGMYQVSDAAADDHSQRHARKGGFGKKPKITPAIRLFPALVTV